MCARSGGACGQIDFNKPGRAALKIAIMGSGGLGGYYGARLQAGGNDVTFIARGEQLKALRQNGIALEGDRAIHLPKVKATDDPATIGKVDMVIFSVKLRDTESAARQLLPVIGPDTGIISLELWQKFVFLVAMSSATASMRSTAGPIRSNPLARQFVIDLMDEVAAVGRAHGVPL